MSSSDEESGGSGGSTKGLFQRVLRFVSSKHSDKSHSNDPSPEEKTQMLLRKQRHDVARRSEFGKLRGMIQEQEAAEEESRLSSLTHRREKPNSRQLETIRKINELENQMANRLSLQQASELPTTASKQIAGASTISSSIQSDTSGFGSSFYSATENSIAGSLFPSTSEGLRASANSATTDKTEKRDNTAEDVLDAIDSVSDLRDAEGSDDELALLSDPMLEESAVLFASNEDELVERNLRSMLIRDAAYRNNRITWQVLMDFYRATGDQAAFDALAMDYTTIFSESAPQWTVFDPMVVKKLKAKSASSGMIYWQSPAIFDDAAAYDMDQKFCSNNDDKIPRLMDWNLVKEITGKSAERVLQILNSLDRPEFKLQVTGLRVILALLEQLTKSSREDRDYLRPLWQLRLELMRFFNMPDEFDMLAMEYCLEFEVSPPDWVKPHCHCEDLDKDSSGEEAANDSAGGTSLQNTTTILTHLATGFYSQSVATPLRLRGELKGNIVDKLAEFDKKLTKDGGFIRINCERLVRIDFVAAGDLLNWVSERASKGYSVQLLRVNRLVALFFIVMGVSVPAHISLRRD